jgi:hypothetical protein
MVNLPKVGGGGRMKCESSKEAQTIVICLNAGLGKSKPNQQKKLFRHCCPAQSDVSLTVSERALAESDEMTKSKYVGRDFESSGRMPKVDKTYTGLEIVTNIPFEVSYYPLRKRRPSSHFEILPLLLKLSPYNLFFDMEAPDFALIASEAKGKEPPQCPPTERCSSVRSNS